MTDLTCKQQNKSSIFCLFVSHIQKLRSFLRSDSQLSTPRRIFAKNFAKIWKYWLKFGKDSKEQLEILKFAAKSSTQHLLSIFFAVFCRWFFAMSFYKHFCDKNFAKIPVMIFCEVFYDVFFAKFFALIFAIFFWDDFLRCFVLQWRMFFATIFCDDFFAMLFAMHFCEDFFAIGFPAYPGWQKKKVEKKRIPWLMKQTPPFSVRFPAQFPYEGHQWN